MLFECWYGQLFLTTKYPITFWPGSTSLMSVPTTDVYNVLGEVLISFIIPLVVHVQTKLSVVFDLFSPTGEFFLLDIQNWSLLHLLASIQSDVLHCSIFAKKQSWGDYEKLFATICWHVSQHSCSVSRVQIFRLSDFDFVIVVN